ncbi:Early meiotic induction protein 1 [Spathaspora sp. JA1]|nr:Early meiotic induction protein 1 [Spathaspora sp. JA1]
MSDKTDKELEEVWKLFEDTPIEIQERRKSLIKTIQDDKTLDYPTSVKVTTSLDEVLECFALGGQVRHYYRYGTYDVCQRQREKFWFAVKNGGFSENNKPVDQLTEKELNQRIKIQEFFKKRVLEDKAAGSSEDIWDQRKVLLSDPFRKK